MDQANSHTWIFISSIYPDMDTKQIISANLSRWMNVSTLSTLKKLSAASGVGFGTVRRACAGDSNLTIDKLEAIAGAFQRSILDLLSDETPRNQVNRSADVYRIVPEYDDAAMTEALLLLRGMDKITRQQAVEHLRIVAGTVRGKKIGVS